MKIFKNYIYSTLIGSLFLSNANASEIYMGINQSFVDSENNKVLSYQPVDELVGGSGNQLEFRLGVTNSNIESNEARVFLYVWNNSEKNSELGFGIGGEWIINPFENKDFGFLIGGQAGIGYQDVEGKKVNLSTNVNKVNYILNSTSFVPTVAQFEDNTYVLDIALTLGCTYKILENLSFDLGYVYKYDMYQVSYRNQDFTTVLNQLSFRQDNHMLKTALNYKF